MSNLIGQTLGPYRIIEQIGIGGMATVYKAYQPSMDRYVAVKVLPAVISRDPAFLKRFRREAKVVAKLEHKHILPVYDYGEQEELTYLVMRFVEAGTLKDRLAAGQLDLPEIYRIMAQVGAALDYAHRLGVIHRDVKPTNVLIDSQGDAYLTDFGLARIMESSEQLTATGVGVGTPAYMAPEQGQGLKIDHRSDIYSLGVMLYEMVTGRVPYEAETPMAVVIKHITDPLPLPSSVKPDISPQVERVILKALAKDPDDRFQTVAEMVTALDRAVRLAQAEAPAEVTVGEPAVAKEATPPAKGFLARAMAGVREATQTGWGKTAMWAAVGVVALLAFFLALSRVPLKVQIRGGQLEVLRVVEATVTPEATAPTTAPAEAVAGATATPVPLPTVAPIPTEEEGALPVVAAPTPTSLGRIVYSDGRTGNDEIYVANSDGSDERRLTDRPAGDWEPAWSPDGTRIVFDSDHHAIGEDRNQLYVMDADGSNLTKLTYTEGNEEHPAWSPDGSRIAFHSNGALAVINPDGSNWTTLVEVRDDLCVQHPTWSPDSRRIAFRSKTPCGDPGPFQHDIYVVNDDGSGLLKLASFTSETAGWYVVWSPDGGQVAFDVELDDQQRYYAINSDGSGEPVEIPSIPDSWYPWYWPQWAGEVVAAPTPAPGSPAEQARTFAEPILAAIADRPPDFEDDFSDPTSGWEHGAYVQPSGWEEGERGYVNGEYFIIAPPAKLRPQHSDRPTTCASGMPIGLQPFSDMVLEIEGRFVEIQDGDWSVPFRMLSEADTKHKYIVGFRPESQVNIFTHVNGEKGSDLAYMRGLPVKGGFETNHLLIVAVGPQVALYVNGEPALFATDPNFDERYKSGPFELVVCNFADTPLEARWDNLRIWDISDLALPSAEATPAPQPTVTLTAVSPPPPKAPYFFDDFESDLDNWPLDATHWNISWDGGEFEVVQEGGQLRMSGSGGSEGGVYHVLPRQYQDVLLDEIGTFEAKLMLASDHTGGHARTEMTLISWAGSRPIWEALCMISADEARLPQVHCYVHIQPEGVYQHTIYRGAAAYDEWYTFRIEVDPETAELFFFLNGEYLDSFIIPEDEVWRPPGMRFSFSVEAGRGSSALATSYVDDVFISPTRGAALPTPTPAPTDTPVKVSMSGDVYSELSGPAGDLASRNPHTGFDVTVQSRNAVQVVVESPSGEFVVLPPHGDIYGWKQRFSASLQGLPQAGGTYTFTALDANGTPIPGAVTSDVYVGGYEPDPPANVQAKVVEAGILVTWEPSPVIPGAFDPNGSPPLGFYQIYLYREDGELVYGWSYERPLPETSCLIPFRRQDFGPGDTGLALEEMNDGVYYLEMHTFSRAPGGTAGYYVDCIAHDPAENIRVVLEGGQVRVEKP